MSKKPLTVTINLPTRDADWKEEEHKRDHGKFAKMAGGSGAKEPPKKAPSHTAAAVRNALPGVASSTSTTSVRGWHNVSSGHKVTQADPSSGIAVSYQSSWSTKPEAIQAKLDEYHKALTAAGYNAERRADHVFVHPPKYDAQVNENPKTPKEMKALLEHKLKQAGVIPSSSKTYHNIEKGETGHIDQTKMFGSEAASAIKARGFQPVGEVKYTQEKVWGAGNKYRTISHAERRYQHPNGVQLVHTEGPTSGTLRYNYKHAAQEAAPAAAPAPAPAAAPKAEAPKPAAADPAKKVHAALSELHQELRAGQSRGMGGQHDAPQPMEGASNALHTAGVRDWGRWESDYDRRGEEDDDYQVLTPESQAKLKAIVARVQAKHPEVELSARSGEKNWLELSAHHKGEAPKPAAPAAAPSLTPAEAKAVAVREAKERQAAATAGAPRANPVKTNPVTERKRGEIVSNQIAAKAAAPSPIQQVKEQAHAPSVHAKLRPDPGGYKHPSDQKWMANRLKEVDAALSSPKPAEALAAIRTNPSYSRFTAYLNALKEHHGKG